MNMKVLILNGSRRSNGCTKTALGLVAKELEESGIETVVFDAGLKVLKGELNEAVKEQHPLLNC